MSPDTEARVADLARTHIATIAAVVIADKIRDWPGVNHPNAIGLIIGTEIADAVSEAIDLGSVLNKLSEDALTDE